MSQQASIDLSRLQNGSDIRGVAIPTAGGKPADLLRGETEAIVQGFVDFLEKKWDRRPEDMKIAVGCDSRLSGPYLKQLLLLSLDLMDVETMDCGLASTPAMFMSTRFQNLRCDGAIMITASHLPYERNGFKFFDWDGGLQKEDITSILERARTVYAPVQSREEEEADMRRAVEDFSSSLTHLPPSERTEAYKGEAPGLAAIREAEALDARTSGAFSARAQIKKERPIFAQAEQPYVPDLMEIYAAHLRQQIREGLRVGEDAMPLEGLHILVDAGNGAGGFFAADVLEPLGANVQGSRFLDPDGSFPHHSPNPEDPAAVAELREAVLAEGADLGLIFDTDVDRSGAVSGKGREIARNGIVALAAAIVAEDYPGSTIVTDSITSTQLSRFLEKSLGLAHLRYKRGYKNVINKARALNAEGVDCPLAIETSGHAALKDNYFLDDGAYLATRIVVQAAKLRREGKSLDDLLAELEEPAEAKEVRMDIRREDYAPLGDEILQDLAEWVERQSEARADEQAGSDRGAAGQTASDRESAGQTASDRESAGQTAFGSEAAGQTASDRESAGQTASDRESAGQTASDTKAAGQTASDTKAGSLRMALVSPNYEGVRINFFRAEDEEAPPMGWCLLRKSLHDPLMPLNLEADEPGGVDAIAQTLRPFFDRYPDLDSSAL